MAIHSHPRAEFAQVGRAYDSDIRRVIMANRSEADISKSILHVGDPFDAFIVNFRDRLEITENPIIRVVAARARDWVEVFGRDAEAIHDAVDRFSVEAGRQDSVGFGHPMTTWDTKLDIDGIASHIATGGQGGSLVKLLVVFGSTEQEVELMDRIKVSLNRGHVG